jgi:hypothetical protein
MRRSPIGVALLVVVAAGCSIESSMPAPDCIDGGSANLGAQAVPTAELVPCFERLPDGWKADGVKIDQDGMLVRFDSDRAGGSSAIFHYTETCDIGDAVSSLSEHEGADRYDHVERVDPAFRAQRYYVFEGGCIWWEFDFDEGATAALSIELGDRLVTVPRDVVNEAVRESFIDEDL